VFLFSPIATRQYLSICCVGFAELGRPDKGKKAVRRAGFMVGAHSGRGAERFYARFSSGFAIEEFQDAAEAFLASDHFECWNVFRSTGLAGQWNVADSLMSSLFMMMGDVLLDQEVQMSLADRHEMVEALALDGSDPAFRVCVHVGTSDGDALNLHAGFVERGVERGPIFGIVFSPRLGPGSRPFSRMTLITKCRDTLCEVSMRS
jgi:hypothetical protein